MSELTEDEQYLLDERLGILCGDGVPTPEQLAIAHAQIAATRENSTLLVPTQPTMNSTQLVPQKPTRPAITITNKSDLPASLVAAVTFSDRDREGCDYTISELLSPPRIEALKAMHADKVTEDAADRLWALMGSAGHEVLKRAAKQLGGAIVEERAIVEIDCGGKKYKIGGQLDYATTDHALSDFKFTSVWAVRDGVKPEWTQQLNCYRYLCQKYGVNIDRLEIIAIMRDWSVREARRSSSDSYPQQQVEVFHIPIWTEQEVETFLCQRITKHEMARTVLPECTAEEMWEKPEKWAAKKKGNKRAARVFDTEAQANTYAAEKGLEVEFRPGERVRCESYCAVAPYCQQFISWQMNNS